ncbi:uncharacterized protein PGTG_20887 [Puccinia graminis f. sp. tritici CRL 75-36-700-3]|uniref:CxC1-like cysteine cluster associated with KDZ transposases domain-containing protein n=1 Tax=Puccinia graminis f. sp. tritici (strain CRL 75-36-700-3 / race SCCL) TaxID=418459 RepID=H6QPG7_PUCGT|nr:uncharacterized protein PGTG_20887 [Puccinia graminis f. sp. tritici CRL 75-36-700-3]EHS63905.1 hypothetical protein PGTG_20887 [Puccinia graminis f. sp. tritici CRL 75-36-700-3]
MIKTRTKRQVPVSRTVRLRREVNHERDLGAYQRLRGFQSPMLGMDQALSSDMRLAEDLTNNVGLEDNPDELHQDSIEIDGDQDSDDGWVPLDIEPPDEFDLAIESNIERLRQEAVQMNWKNLLKDLHSVYMAQKVKTKNWTHDNTYTDFTACNCISGARRAIDLVDIHGQRRAKIKFCSCTSDAVRLIQMGYLPGSPIRPVTAFSLPLLILHNCLWNNCHIGAMPFTMALKQYLEPRSQRLTVQNAKHARDLRKPFSAAVDLYRELNDRTENLISSVLRLDEQTIMACRSCPACFGPAPENLQDYTRLKENKLIVCLDGNFQHRHHSKASRDYDRIHTPSLFLQRREVDEMTAKIREIELSKKPKDKKDKCTEAHKAADDKRNESSWKGCDDTGLMGCCCRHDAAIYMANIHKSGEQRCYPMALVNKLLNNVESDRHVGILYDIGCSLDKYMALRGLLDDKRTRLRFGTSVFHAYVHSWTCQLDYNPRLNEGWGLSDGEGLERMWSFLSPLVSPLRYATRNHRLAAISHRLKYHNTRGIKQLPTWLKKKFIAAVRRRVETKQVLSELLDKPNPFSRTVYKEEAALEALRSRLRKNPMRYLHSEQEVHELLDELEETADNLKKAQEELGRTEQPDPDEADEEQRLLLLLWDAKSELFVQAVQFWSEKQPLTDSRTIGRRLGTKLSQKIQQAINNRKGPINKVIKNYNRCFEAYVSKFPRQRVTDANNHPLDYDTFASMPIDHKFWNDGIYYNSKAPWAIEPDVRTGITCLLVLGRVDEELDLITQEVDRTMQWAIFMYSHLTESIKYIRARKIKLGDGVELAEDHIDTMEFGNFDRVLKLKIINKELQARLFDLGILIQEWDEPISWLCARCRPELLRSTFTRWTNLLMTVANDHNTRSQESTRKEPEVVLNNLEEDAILGVHVDDGEEVHDGEQPAGETAGDWEDVDDAHE